MQNNNNDLHTVRSIWPIDATPRGTTTESKGNKGVLNTPPGHQNYILTAIWSSIPYLRQTLLKMEGLTTLQGIQRMIILNNRAISVNNILETKIYTQHDLHKLKLIFRINLGILNISTNSFVIYFWLF